MADHLKIKYEYRNHIFATNKTGSKKASTYFAALEKLGPILEASEGPFRTIRSVWSVTCPERASELYEYILGEQRSGDVFAAFPSPSYWKKGHYSAALNSYRKFLVEFKFAEELFGQYTGDDFVPEKFELEIPNTDILTTGLDEFEGKTKLREVKTRVNQRVFRRRILQIYGNECCVTGINVPELNRASHIVPWAEQESSQLDPANGLLLSGTYDAAFDSHLISIDSGYRVLVSKRLKDFYTKEVVKQYFAPIEGLEITRPSCFPPREEYLKIHRSMLQR